ncbi:predicted protein [Histoplasma capsulatum G186AR]|uniref:Uncharacterized protein n=1 Tax=Ajellomyces capsulatus (strain G186AR / H82 / ATCC MYA-2454 / RMSCC 2432) TaxID=447093 RepID=C0NM71_AJECG|nr:uncharacterized protein HCBG_04601 [Histoplasma capsulatum G186AR]EEH07722.1 predicted protein [Histoplasma capsulatum G186AR]
MDEVEVSATGFLKRDDELTTALARWHGASAKNFQNMDCVDSIDKLTAPCIQFMPSEPLRSHGLKDLSASCSSRVSNWLRAWKVETNQPCVTTGMIVPAGGGH